MGERFEIPAGDGPGAAFPRAAPGAYDVGGRTRRGFAFGASLFPPPPTGCVPKPQST